MRCAPLRRLFHFIPIFYTFKASVTIFCNFGPKYRFYLSLFTTIQILIFNNSVSLGCDPLASFHNFIPEDPEQRPVDRKILSLGQGQVPMFYLFVYIFYSSIELFMWIKRNFPRISHLHFKILSQKLISKH